MSPKAQAIGFSLAVHAALLTLLTVSFASGPAHVLPSPKPVEVVEAVAVDETQVQAELEKLKAREQARRDAEQDRQRRLANEAERMRQAKETEARRLADLKLLREREAKAQVAEKARLDKLKAEQQLVAREKAELEKKRAAEQVKLAALEQQRKSEEEARRKAEEVRKRAEAEAKRQEEARKKAEAETALKAKLEAEAKRQEQERLRHQDVQMAQYVADIRNKVERNWLRPAGSSGSAACKVLVYQIPGGEVANVRLLQSCGDAALDRSVEAAVRKASPLPAPPDPALFEKEIVFEFKAR